MHPVPILITVSEPWDVGEAVAWAQIRGEIVAIESGPNRDRALVRFAAPLQYRGAGYHSAVAYPRVAGTWISDVDSGSVVGVALTCTTADASVGAAVPDSSAWRGGLAFVADLQRDKGT
ncbi:MAG: hypothetical protein U1F09_01070 [Steroidobacteraceae bacterium]